MLLPFSKNPDVLVWRMNLEMMDSLTLPQPVIFPGSFNPLHDGHKRLANAAYQYTGKPVWLEVSSKHCHKDDTDNLTARAYALGELREDWLAGVLITDEATFEGKAKGLMSPQFLVGADVLVLMEKEYPDDVQQLKSLGITFLAGSRTGVKVKDIPTIGPITTFIGDYVDHGESSTEIRRRTNG